MSTETPELPTNPETPKERLIDSLERRNSELTARIAELEKARDEDLKRLLSVAATSVESLVNRHLRLLKELNERDKPAGFDSWEAYHKYIEGMKAALAEARKDSARIEKAQKDAIYEALTIQALRMYNEVFKWGGMDQKHFARTYLNGIGDYERTLAKREGIAIDAATPLPEKEGQL